MNLPTDIHEPTAEFRGHLEWQIETAMRRESRLAEPVSGFTPPRWFPTLVIVLLALVAGGAAGIASERVQDAKTRSLLLENAKAERALLRTSYDLVNAELKEARRRFEIGAATREEVSEALRRADAAEASLVRLDIDIMEIEKTSTPPRDELTAPKVENRDFVAARLNVDLGIAQRELAAAEEAIAKAKERFEVGLTTNAALVRAGVELAAARTQMQQLQMRIALREKYLHDQLTVEELQQQLRRAELTLEADLARQQLAAAFARLDSLKRMVEIGTIPQLDVKRAEVELLELELKVKRIQQQLGAVKKEE